MDNISQGFYDVINLIIDKECRRLTSLLFKNEFFEKLKTEEEKRLFVLFQKISSLSVDFKNGVAEYSSGFIYGKDSSFNLSDITEEEYLLLNSVNVKKLPALIRARISNIIWNSKKDILMVEIAIESYYELYNLFYDTNDWVNCVKYIKQGINLARKVNKNEEADTYINRLISDVLKENGEDKSYYSISIIEFLVEINIEDKIQMIDVLDKIIEKNNDNINKVEEAYRLKIKIFSKIGDNTSVKRIRLQLAEYLESISDKKDDIRNLFVEEQNLKKAILIFKEEKKKEEQKNATNKLKKVQKEILKYMIPISVEKDLTEEHDKYISLFQNLSFEQAVVRLIQTVPIIRKEEIENRVLNNSTNPIACLFDSEIKNEKGYTVESIPGLDISDPKKDMSIFEMHMNREALQIESAYGVILWWGIEYLKRNYVFEKQNLSFLVEENAIIPQGRDQVFLSAIFYGLNGDMYEALHILAPQMENTFRTIAEEAGSVMVDIKKDYTVQEQLLTHIFKDDLLWDCYDNDILFLFKGLLNEKSGANIRNEIAHGIMTREKGNSGIAVYFYCLVLKMLSFTSIKYYQIIKDFSENDNED